MNEIIEMKGEPALTLTRRSAFGARNSFFSGMIR